MCENHLALCQCTVTLQQIKFSSLPPFLQISIPCCPPATQFSHSVSLSSSWWWNFHAKRKHSEPRMFPSPLAREIKTWLFLLGCAWGDSLLCSLLSHPLSPLLSSILTLHQWNLSKTHIDLIMSLLKIPQELVSRFSSGWASRRKLWSHDPCAHLTLHCDYLCPCLLHSGQWALWGKFSGSVFSTLLTAPDT